MRTPLKYNAHINIMKYIKIWNMSRCKKSGVSHGAGLNLLSFMILGQQVTWPGTYWATILILTLDNTLKIQKKYEICPNAIESGVCHRTGLDLSFCVDFEPTGHMTWDLLSYNAHIYNIKCIKNS